MTKTLLLWILATSIHLALLWRVWHEYKWRYGTRSWRQGWGCFTLALSLLLVRRWSLFAYPSLRQDAWFLALDDFTPLMNSVLLYLFVWRLSKVFHVELPMVTTTEATIGIDSHSMIVEWAPATALLFGWTAEEVVGKKTLMQTIIPPREWEAHRYGMARFHASLHKERRLPRTFHVDACTKGGALMRVEIVVRATHIEGESWRFQATIRRLRTL